MSREKRESLLPPPNTLGLPKKYTFWRKHQDDAIISLSASDKRFVGLVVPTGGGKSLTYMTHAEMSGAVRTVVLTSTKSLQDQLGRDFEVADIRGKGNYDCVHEEAEEGTKVSEAACQGGGFRCPYRDNWEKRTKENGEEYWHLIEGSGCHYYDRLKEARVAPLVVTNYSYWLSIGSTGKGLGPFDLLVLDEAHAAPDELAGFLSVVVTKADSMSCLGRGLPREDETSWWEWIEGAWVDLNHQITMYGGRHLGKDERARMRKITKLLSGVARIRTIGAKYWVVEKKRAGTRWESVSWDITNPAPYAEQFLFQGIKHVVLSSATVREKTLKLLGVGNGNAEMLEYPSIFPVERRPVIVPTGVPRMNFRVTDGQKELWLEIIDEIIEGRLDRRGIIHAVSFQRAKEVVAQSRHRKIMVMHESGSEGLRKGIEEYLGKCPSVLVSPSATTGIDLPYCLSPETRVLTADLTWVPVGDLIVGAEIAGFEEMASETVVRRWKKAVVTSTRLIDRPSYEIKLADGTVVVASAEHKWLVRGTGVARWVRTDKLRFGPKIASHLYRVLPVWETDVSRGGGYLAAAFDGEASLYQGRSSDGHCNATALAYTQNYNEMLLRVMEELEDRKFLFDIFTKTNRCFTLRLRNRAETLRFLGSIRPPRLLPKFSFDKLGALRMISMPRVVSVRPLGSREVVALATTTKTLVAEGLASHNSQCEYQIIGKVPFPDMRAKVLKARMKIDPDYPAYIAAQVMVQASGRGMRAEDDRAETFVLDGNFGWFIGKYAAFTPRWWRAAVKRVEGVPGPPEKLTTRHLS